MGIPDNVVIGQASSSGQSPIVVAVSPVSEPISVTVPMPETVREGYLEVRQVGSNAVITTIEVLSPKNKRSGRGRDQYERLFEKSRSV